MSVFFTTVRSIWSGKGVTRSLLNVRLAKETLSGNTIDIGGGKNATYVTFMSQTPDTIFTTFDQKSGDPTDFESDPLPAATNTYDTVLFLNVLEHIFNYQHLVDEVVRVTKPGGQIIGFVPFLMWYHPDHHDYWRYTHETLDRIFANNGDVTYQIESISRGPFTAAAQMILFSLPRVLRLFVYVPFYTLDSIFLWLRPTHGERYALGYYFVLTKKPQTPSG